MKKVKFHDFTVGLTNEEKTNLWHSIVYIITMWAVNYDSLPGVFFIESNVIVHENYNVFIFQPTFLQELIGMTDIGLKITINSM